jgi:hypothetical protein
MSRELLLISERIHSTTTTATGKNLTLHANEAAKEIGAEILQVSLAANKDTVFCAMVVEKKGADST